MRSDIALLLSVLGIIAVIGLLVRNPTGTSQLIGTSSMGVANLFTAAENPQFAAKHGFGFSA